MAAAERGDTRHLAWRPDRLPRGRAYVADTIRRRYPDSRRSVPQPLAPFRGGRHRSLGADRGRLARRPRRAGAHADRSRDHERSARRRRRRAWRYVDAATGTTLARSEGLAVAGLRLFAAGAFSARADAPYAADARALARLDTATLAQGFQVAADNPLVGLEGRAALLRRLGVVAAATPAVFGTPARLGHLYDYLAAHARGWHVERRIPAGNLAAGAGAGLADEARARRRGAR